MFDYYLHLLAAIVSWTTFFSVAYGQYVCDSSSRKYLINPDARIHIGVILPIRESGKDGSGCGNVLSSGIQQLEAMKWLVSVLNQESGQIGNITITDSYIDGVEIGMTIEDSCSTEPGALYSAVDINQPFLSTNDTCIDKLSRYNIGMITGTTGNATTSLASLLSTRQMALISYADSSVYLNDVTKYPYMLRTVPDYRQLAEIIVKVFDILGWQTISIIHSDDTEARTIMSELLRAAYRNGTCIAKLIKVKTKQPHVYYKDIITTLLITNVTGTVYLGDIDVLLAVMDSMPLVHGAGRLQFIASTTAEERHSLLERTYAKGLVLVSHSSRHLPEFADYWDEIQKEKGLRDNPLLAEWYMATKQCRLTGVGVGQFSKLPVCELIAPTLRGENVQDPLIEPLIIAIYTYAKALKNAHLDLCKGQYGLCSSLESLPPRRFSEKYLRTLNFTFSLEERIQSLVSSQSEPYLSTKKVSYSKTGELSGAGFDIWTVNDVLGFVEYHKIGSYVDHELDLIPSDFIFYDITRQDVLYDSPLSLCQKGGCTRCIISSSSGPQVRHFPSKYIYLPGTIVIATTMAVHQSGEDALSCGSTDGFEGVQLAEAFIYILDQINGADIFPRWITVGGVVLDDCESPEKAISELTDLETGKLQIFSTDGTPMDPKSILAYVSGNNDPILMAVGRLSTKLSRPLLSYRSANSLVLDTMSYKYIAEVVPDIKKQVEVLVSFLKQMKWSYIQVLYSNDEYGKDAWSMFRKKTIDNKICISSSHEIAEGSEMTSKLRSDRRSKVVVTFLQTYHYFLLVDGLNNSGIYREFVFLTDINWPRTSDIIDQYPASTHGFITLSLKDGSSAGFLSHLEKIPSSNYTINPWFREWYERVNNCYLSGTSRNIFMTPCADIPITESKAFKLNDQTIHVMNAVYSIAWGLDATLKNYCGLGYDRLCASYMEGANRSEVLFNNILNVWFNDDTMTPHHFSERSGNRPVVINNINNGVSVKIAEYTFGAQSFYIRKSAIVNYLNSLMPTDCVGRCTECVYLSQVTDDIMYTSGNLILGAVLNVHEAGLGSFDCSKRLNGDAVQLAEAMRFALDKVNDRQAPVKVNGVKLGGLILDGCHSDIRSANIISSVHFGVLNIKDGNNKLNVDSVLSWMTEDVSYSHTVIQTLGLIHVLLKGSGHLENGLISMVPEYHSEHLINATYKILREMNITNINIISTNSNGFIKMIKNSSAHQGICITNIFNYNDDISPADLILHIQNAPSHVTVLYLNASLTVNLLKAREYTNGNSDIFFILIPTTIDEVQNVPKYLLKQTIILEQHSPYIDEFDQDIDEQPIPSPSNPWIRSYYEELYGCKLEEGYAYKETCKNRPRLTLSRLYKQSNLIINAMNYVYLMASAIHRSLVVLCGVNYSGICKMLSDPSVLRVEVQNQLPLLSFEDIRGGLQRLDKDGLLVPEYSVNLYNWRSEFKTRVYRNGILSGTPDDNWRDVASTYGCPPVCQRCSNSSLSSDYHLRVGDLIIGGLFNVHVGNVGMTCGKINVNRGFLLAEAFNFAIQYINQKRGIFADQLDGVTLGYLSLDACQSPAKATKLLSDTLSGLFKTSGADLPEKLVAFISPFTTDLFMPTSALLNGTDIVQVSYGVPATEYFSGSPGQLLNVTPSDNTDINVIVAILQRISIQYVQVVFSDSTYGRNAVASFKNLTRISNICIAQSISFYANNNTNTVVEMLLSKSKAKTVVLLLDSSHIRPFLLAMERGTTAVKTYHLIASHTWPDNTELLRGLGSFILNTIVIYVQSTYIQEFDKYLAVQTPQNNIENTWLEEYYEELFDCNLKSTTSLQERCSAPFKSLVESPDYKQEPYTGQVINLVFSLAITLHNTIGELCGENRGICQRFWSNKGALLAKKLKLTTFQDLSGEEFSFLDDGYSDKGFNIKSVAMRNGSYYYRKIASYNSKRGLNWAVFEPRWNSTCDGLCYECESITSSSEHHVTISTPSSANIMAFMPIHKASKEDPLDCGEIDPYYGFYNMLAFFYAIDRINKVRDFSLPSTIRLGGTVVDTCDNRFTIAENAVALLSKDERYAAEFGRQENYIGFMAMNNDDVDLLRELTKIKPSVIISPSLMSSSHSDNDSFILRTKVSEEVEGRAIAEIAHRMSWVYVAVIKSHDFRTGAVQAFLEAARNHSGICVGIFQTMPYRSGYADALDVVDAVQKITGINVLILFTNPSDTRFILRAVADLQLDVRFTFLGGTGWGDNIEASSGLIRVARGSIVIQSRVESIVGFDSYVTSLTLNDHGVIPQDWFDEFWQRTKRCRLENATKPLIQFRKKCSSNTRLTSADVLQNNNVLYTIISTQILAVGLKGVSECSHFPAGISACLSSLPDGARRLYESTKAASWRNQMGLLNDDSILDFEFTNGFGNLGFSVGSIYDDGNFFKIGYYYDEDLTLDINQYESRLRSMDAKFRMRKSQCPHNKMCICEHQTGQNGSVIRLIRNADNSQALLSTAYYSNFSTSWGLAFLVLSGSGIAVALVIFIYLLASYPDRGGTSVLGYLLLFAVMLIYAVNFAFLLHPDPVICDVRKFGLGFVYALAFACMFLKVMIIWQHEGVDCLPEYRKFKHPASLFFVAVGLSLVQAAMATEWIVLAPSGTETVFLRDGKTISVCMPPAQHYPELAMSCIYVMLLMFLTLVFSGVTFYSEENCRESRWIMTVAVLNIVVSVLWIAFSCTMDYAVRDRVTIVANLVNGSITLLLVFIRKLYLLTKFVRKDKLEMKTSREITFIKTKELTDDDIPREPVMTFISPNRGHNIAESVHSGKGSERFYFGTNTQWDMTM